MSKNIIYINSERDFKKYRRLINEAKDEVDFIDETYDFDDDDEEVEEKSLYEADGDNAAEQKPEEPMDEEKLRIESLKLATSMAKLMDNVTPDDIIKIAGLVAEFIRDNRNSADLSSNENPFESEPADEFESDEELPEFEEENNEE